MITLLSVTDGHKHFDAAISEYLKRSSKYLRIKYLKPVSHTNVEYIKVKETLAIIEALGKLPWIHILLDERGKALTTNEFVEFIETSKNESTNITFIIWGSYGVDLELITEVKPKMIKISDFVMPHGLAFLVLIEQIYRAHEIMKWSGYHHA